VGQGWRFAGVALALWLGIGDGKSEIAHAWAQGVQLDPVEPFEQYRRGAAQGDASALNSLGSLYETGSGVPVDLAKAYALFTLATSMPNANQNQAASATQKRDSLAVKMSSVQLARAQELISLCYGGDINTCGERIISAGQASALRLGKTVVPLENANGVYFVPAIVNGGASLKFAVDTGAADVAMPADVVAVLMKAGLVSKADFLGQQTYVLADGSRMPSLIFQIRSLKVGDVVITNVRASITPEKRGATLLGQSFFGRLKSWSLDNARHALIIE
jgi:aspartyl protease family protein